jgi:hypothetical protein
MQAHTASDSPRRGRRGRGAYLPDRLGSSLPASAQIGLRRRTPLTPGTVLHPKSAAKQRYKRRVSFFRDSAAFPSNSCSLISRQQYTIAGQNAVCADACAQASPVIVHARPLPLLGALGQANPHRAEVNMQRFFVCTPKGLNMSSRGQGRGVLRPPPTDGVPSNSSVVQPR